MKNKIIYGIEFKNLSPSEWILMSECFNMVFSEFESGLSVLHIVFFNPTTHFKVERNTIEQTFFDFFTMMPNAIKDNEFDNISRAFFANYKNELDDKFHRRTFGAPLNFDGFDKNLPPIESINA